MAKETLFSVREIAELSGYSVCYTYKLIYMGVIKSKRCKYPGVGYTHHLIAAAGLPQWLVEVIDRNVELDS